MQNNKKIDNAIEVLREHIEHKYMTNAQGKSFLQRI